MIVPLDTPTLAPAIPDLPVRRFSVDEYHRMIGAGIVEEAVELLEGWIVPKMSKNPPHVWSVARAAKLLQACLPPGWHVRRRDPIALPDSEPEPDIAAVRGTEEDYRTRHPEPKDVGLGLEVAESTLQMDRTTKGRVYARANIPVYWIVNLVDNQVEFYTDPTGTDDPEPHYRQRHVYGMDDMVPVVIDGKQVGTIAVRDLLP